MQHEVDFLREQVRQLREENKQLKGALQWVVGQQKKAYDKLCNTLKDKVPGAVKKTMLKFGIIEPPPPPVLPRIPYPEDPQLPWVDPHRAVAVGYVPVPDRG